jgi:predicted phage terminase large subunit-like protein
VLAELNKELSRARRSPSSFAEFCFAEPSGAPLEQGQVHCDLQAFLSRHPRALVELPRDHGKSVQVCIRILWELGHNPALRVQLVCASHNLAVARCRFLRDALATNALLRLTFPKLCPARPWRATHFTVQRPANVIGPSVTALSIGAASTGNRADLLVCDDIVDVRALRSKAERERVKTYFYENLMNQLEPTGRFWGLCTPWHPDDLNAVLKQNDAYQLFRRAVGNDLEPVWPEKWPKERLEERRREIGSLAFARAYHLLSVPDGEVPIRPAWLRYWTEPVEYERVVLAVDPAVSQRQGADYSALVALGQTASHEIHCLEATARRVNVPDLIQLIDAADQRWRPLVIVFESNGAFEGIRELLLRQTRFGPKLKGVTQSKDKTSRVHAFSVPVENGCFRLKGRDRGHVDEGQQALYDELVTFPYGEHDDLLDAAMMGTAYLLERPEPRVW